MKYIRKGKGLPIHYSAPLLNDLVEILAFMFYLIFILLYIISNNFSLICLSVRAVTCCTLELHFKYTHAS